MMTNDEKKCPLTSMTCWGDSCGIWNGGECGLLTIADKMKSAADELYWTRRFMEDNL